MTITVVIGPPAGGKSTWVQANAKAGDIIIDFDKLAVALAVPGGDPHDHSPVVMLVARAARTAAIDAAVKQAGKVDVYLIHSNPGRGRMAEYRAMGAKVVTVDPGREVVRERAKRERPLRMLTVIDEWYREQKEQAEQGPSGTPRRSRSAAPIGAFPAAVSRQW